MQPQRAYAEQALEHVRLVAVFVEDDLLAESRIASKVTRYTKNYIQQKLADSHAITIPVDDTMRASDIREMIDAMDRV